ncbi:MAG: DNA-formamidopyrimidine glycosylase family protein [Sandaracinaceae bacterium]
MPELPEAEHGRTILERVLVGRRISVAHVQMDPIVFESRAPSWVADRLVGRTVVTAHRKGKYLWLELDEGPHVILHFGMTGTLRTPNDRPLVLSSSPAEPDLSWPPKFTKLELLNDRGERLAFTNARRLGRVLFRDDPRGEDPIASLGFDAYLELPRIEAFRALLGRRKRAVLKGLLLDQGFAAGVGNWIADEVLYQAKLDPRRRVESLDPTEVAALRKAIGHVVTTAVGADADHDQLPKRWLFHRRWGKDAAARTHDGRAIEFIEIGGRTTAWVPSVQR